MEIPVQTLPEEKLSVEFEKIEHLQRKAETTPQQQPLPHPVINAKVKPVVFVPKKSEPIPIDFSKRKHWKPYTKRLQP